MRIEFKLDMCLLGYATSTTKAGEAVQVCARDFIGPQMPHHLQQQLENFHAALFSKIPGLPAPSMIDHLLVIIQPNLDCVAYVNELGITAVVTTKADIKAGSTVYEDEIADITSVDVGVEVPSDCGVLLIRTMGWKRSLFFDFMPLGPKATPREYPLQRAFAKQALLLLGLGGNNLSPPRVSKMKTGLDELKALLRNRCEEEHLYQKLLHDHSWMFGPQYKKMDRHIKFDDANIPDFVATRNDNCHESIEIKQPFLNLFLQDGEFSAFFHQAWSQAERYITMATEQRSYLLSQKELRFENPRCLLILGYNLSEQQLRRIRQKESHSKSIYIQTYDQLIECAERILNLVREAGDQELLLETKDGPTSAQAASQAIVFLAPSEPAQPTLGAISTTVPST